MKQSGMHETTGWMKALSVGALLCVWSGCASTPPARDDVGRIPERLVSGIVVVKSAETSFVEQKQALLDAVAVRESRRISAVEKNTAKTVAALNVLRSEAPWSADQTRLLNQVTQDYASYFEARAKMARLLIVEQPGRMKDSGLADQEKPLLAQEKQVRDELQKLSAMMVWELTRKIDTVNALILKKP